MAVIIGSKATVKVNRGATFTVRPGFTGFVGNSWYVSSTYNGSIRNGKIDTPWTSISEMRSNINNGTNNRLIRPGDIVYFKRGDTFTGAFNFFSINGLPGRPFTFSAYGTGNKPKFVGTTSAMDQLVYLQGSSYIVFDNLEIIDPLMSSTDRDQDARIKYAFKTDLNPSDIPSTNIIVQNCDISLVGIAAVFNPKSSFNTFTGCNVSNLRMIRDTNDFPIPPPGKDDDFGANGLTVASSNNVITNNVFRDCYAVSYDYRFDGGGVEFFQSESVFVENNLIAYNTFYNNNGTFEFGSNGGGQIRNNVFAYNRIINCDGLFYINNEGKFAVTSSNNQFYNNIIVEVTGSRLGSPSNIMSMADLDVTRDNMVTLKNNVFFIAQSGSRVGKLERVGNTFVEMFNSTNLKASNNVYTLFNGSTMNFSIGGTDFFSSGSYTQYWTNIIDPDPLNWSYSPLLGSILIDNGVNVNQSRDFANNPVLDPPEIGILEYL